MNQLEAAMTLTADEDATSEDEFEAMQTLIDAGSVWGMEGHMGRTAMAMIEDGMCMLGPDKTTDYYGNPIPSRVIIKAGTKGSRTFANERREAVGLGRMPLDPEVEAQAVWDAAQVMSWWDEVSSFSSIELTGRIRDEFSDHYSEEEWDQIHNEVAEIAANGVT